jgi:hypothetical protein
VRRAVRGGGGAARRQVRPGGVALADILRFFDVEKIGRCLLRLTQRVDRRCVPINVMIGAMIYGYFVRGRCVSASSHPDGHRGTRRCGSFPLSHIALYISYYMELLYEGCGRACYNKVLSLLNGHRAARRASTASSWRRPRVRTGLYPIVTFEKQLLNMMGDLV